MPKPFQQSRFEDVPELPRKPHLFFETEGRDLALDSRAFGMMKAHVRVFGNGPPLYLVHGLMTSSYSWRYVFGELGKRYTCYAVDLPANGQSDAPQEPPYSAANLGTFLAEVQEALGIRGCPVVANSMGGYLAMSWAMRDPSAMSALVNLHSPGVPLKRLWALRAALAAPGVAPLLARYIRRDPMRWVHKNVHYYDETLKSLEEARQYAEPLRDAEGAQGLIKYLSETMSPIAMRDFIAELPGHSPFPVPLLLLYARKDPMVPAKVGEELRDAIPSAEFRWLEDASHFAHVDAPETFLAPTLDFLSRHE